MFGDIDYIRYSKNFDYSKRPIISKHNKLEFPIKYQLKNEIDELRINNFVKQELPNRYIPNIEILEQQRLKEFGEKVDINSSYLFDTFKDYKTELLNINNIPTIYTFKEIISDPRLIYIQLEKLLNSIPDKNAEFKTELQENMSININNLNQIKMLLESLNIMSKLEKDPIKNKLHEEIRNKPKNKEIEKNAFNMINGLLKNIDKEDPKEIKNFLTSVRNREYYLSIDDFNNKIVIKYLKGELPRLNIDKFLDYYKNEFLDKNIKMDLQSVIEIFKKEYEKEEKDEKDEKDEIDEKTDILQDFNNATGGDFEQMVNKIDSQFWNEVYGNQKTNNYFDSFIKKYILNKNYNEKYHTFSQQNNINIIIKSSTLMKNISNNKCYIIITKSDNKYIFEYHYKK